MLDNTQYTVAQPEPGKVRVYFIHDAGMLVAHPMGYPIAKLGVDEA